MAVYYNEHDPFCAAWLRNLVRAGIVAPGDVDDRDIRDVTPADLAGYTQAHFFAGIGLWSHALRSAGWSDDRPIWTGSCPCQPFSAAGRGAGFADERHLWPAWHWLIGECGPATLMGEQVGGPDGGLWLDLVCADLEALGYACAAALPTSAGVGAPNIRERIYWVADAYGGHTSAGRLQRGREHGCEPGGGAIADGSRAAERTAQNGGMGHPARGRSSAGPRNQDARYGQDQPDGSIVARGLEHSSGDRQYIEPGTGGIEGGARVRRGQFAHAGRVGDASDAGLQDAEPLDLFGTGRRREGGTTEQSGGPHDPWRELEWIACLDGKRRPTQPGIFPLAARRPGDVAKLRAYGNAINPAVATEVIRAYLERDR